MKKWIALATGLSLVLSGFAAAGFQPSKVQAADRTGFVQTDGTQFLLDGSTFYYAGTNNYYLNFKPQYEVDQVMEDAAAMGLKVIRTWGNLDAGVKTDKVNKDGYTVFTDSVDGSGKRKAFTTSTLMLTLEDQWSMREKTACRSWTTPSIRQSRKVSGC